MIKKFNKSNVDVLLKEVGYLVKEFSMTDKERVENCKLHGLDLFSDFYLQFYKKILSRSMSEEEIEERNDVYVYKTLRYPPKSTPPTLN